MENQIINETSIEDILKDDNEAIKWLNSIDDPKFKNILNILYKYAKECLRDLSKKDLTKGLDKEAKKEIIEKVNAQQLLNAVMQDEKNVQDKVKKQIQIQGKKLKLILIMMRKSQKL